MFVHGKRGGVSWLQTVEPAWPAQIPSAAFFATSIFWRRAYSGDKVVDIFRQKLAIITEKPKKQQLQSHCVAEGLPTLGLATMTQGKI